MSLLSVKNLVKSRHGVYYFRLRTKDGERRFSLGTKDKKRATDAILQALLTSIATGMSFDPKDVKKAPPPKNTRDWKITAADGTTFEGEDHEKAALTIATGYAASVAGVKRRVVDQTPPTPTPQPDHLKATGLISDRANEYYFFLLGEVERRKKTEHVKASEEKTIEERYNTIKDFLSVCKLEHVDLNHVGPTHAATYRKALQEKGQAKSYINKRVSFLKMFFYQMKQDAYYFHDNPFDAQRLKVKKSTRKKRDSLSPEDIEAVFSKVWYKKMEIRGKPMRPSFRWVPIMLLYTGCNPEEIASLPMKNIKKTKLGRYTIEIDADHAKAGARERVIPLAKELTGRYGLGAFLDQRITAFKDPNELLFPDLKWTGNGYNHDAAKKFNGMMAAMRKTGVIEGNKSLVCFRHTLINKLKNDNVNDGLSRAITGHSQISDVHSGHYEDNAAPGTFQAIEKILDAQTYELEYFK